MLCCRWLGASAFALAVPSGAATPLQMVRRDMNQGRSVQTQWTQDNMQYNSRRSDYDFDKEAWSKQMKFATMDCIMDPSIVPPRMMSFEGAKKYFRRYMNMKKLTERRPGFSIKDLEVLYVRYRHLIHTRDSNDFKLLMRFTTHTEAARIQKDIEKRLTEEFKTKSWVSMKLNLSKKKPQRVVKPAASSESAQADAEAAGAEGDAIERVKDPVMKSAANANEAVLAVTLQHHYDVQITRFELVTSYMAQMSAEDWLQLTFRCEYFEKESAKGEPIEPLELAKDTAPGDKEQQFLRAGYTKVTEYPVFEVRMGDNAVMYPFIVVGIMRQDGTRYGRDAQDAANLKKQFDRSSKWF